MGTSSTVRDIVNKSTPISCGIGASIPVAFRKAGEVVFRDGLADTELTKCTTRLHVSRATQRPGCEGDGKEQNNDYELMHPRKRRPSSYSPSEVE